MDFGTTVLGAMAIVLGLIMPVTLVGIILWYRAHRNQLLHETALSLAEKGQPIPAELFVDSKPYSNLRRGVVLVMLGLGICLALYLYGMRFWAFGIIPLFTGAGYLIVWKIESRTQRPTTMTK